MFKLEKYLVCMNNKKKKNKKNNKKNAIVNFILDNVKFAFALFQGSSSISLTMMFLFGQ